MSVTVSTATQDLLLAHFDTIAGAPGGVARLRQLILQLAVQGRLVEQNPSDEPASLMLERIRAAKTRLVKEGKLRKIELPVSSAGTQELYPLPQGWLWTDFESVSSYIQRGKSPRYALSSAFPVIAQKCIQWNGLHLDRAKFIEPDSVPSYEEVRLLRAGDLLWNSTGTGTLGRAVVYQPEINPYGWAVADSHVTVIRPIEVESRYLFIWIASPRVQSEIEAKSSGSTNQIELATSTIRSHPLPLPPLAEQRRIVERVDALMALCDALEERQAREDEERRRLLRALINTLLSARDAGEAAAAWARLSDSFDLVLVTSEDVAPLRQAVLQLAVQGRLVEQDPSDEPASVLLERLETERRHLAVGQRVKVSRAFHPVSQNGEPTHLPPGWSCKPLGELVDPRRPISYGVLVPGPDVEDGVPFVRVQDLDVKNPPVKPNKTISAEVEEQYARTRLLGGEILLGVVGSIGRVGVAPNTWAGANIARAVSRIAPMPQIDRDFLVLVLQSSRMQEYFGSATRTLAQPTLNVSLVETAQVPIPPFAEQRRIVSRVEQLMALCDGLEARLREERAAAERLAEALCAAVAAGQPVEQPQVPATVQIPAEDSRILELPGRVRVLDLDAYTIFAARVIQQHQGTPTARTLGHVKLEKTAHLAEPYGGVDLGRRPQAMPRGPADFDLLTQVIDRGRELNAFDAPARAGSAWGYQFVALPELDALAGRFHEVFGAQAARLDQLITLLVPLKSRQAEAVATLYAVWNDLIRTGTQPDDEQIFAAFRAFHPRKERFRPEVLDRWLKWMRTHGVTPDGSGKPTLPASQRHAPAMGEVDMPATAAETRLARRAAKRPTTPSNGDGYTAAAALLAERGSVTNGDVQAALGVDAQSARALLKRLVAEGLARKEGERRGARYVWTGRQCDTVT